ncbi:MAG: hypothetical protein GY796_31585 [Chloroflexi bacterium]|nr:hypothetical protein [Chloroflexota bacterium]
MFFKLGLKCTLLDAKLGFGGRYWVETPVSGQAMVFGGKSALGKYSLLGTSVSKLGTGASNAPSVVASLRWVAFFVGAGCSLLFFANKKGN